MIRRPPRSTRTDTLFPYTTLFRSCHKLIITLALAEKVIIAPDTRQPASWPRNPTGRQLCADDAILRDEALNDSDRQRCVNVALKAAARFVEGEGKRMAHPPFIEPQQMIGRAHSELQSLMRISYA